MKWTLAWSRKTNGREPVPAFQSTVSTVEELDRELDRITELASQTDPLLVDLFDADSPDSPSLGIGVGANRSVAAWTMADGAPGSMGSRGDGAGTGSELWFVWSGEPTSFDPDSTIDVKAAREAMREFLQTGTRPTNVEWEAV